MLAVANLVAGYGQVQVLHGIDLEVPEGALVTLIGSNGAGKSTILRALSGMITPQSGSIRLAGEEIAGLASFQIARRGMAHSPEGRPLFPAPPPTHNLPLPAFS